MAPISYSIAGMADLSLLVDYRMQFLEEISGIQNEETTARVRQNLQQYFSKALQDGSYICWVAKDGDTVAGIGGLAVREQPANFKIPNGKAGYIMNMYTLPAYRRQGIAGKLLEHLMETAREMNLSVLELHATYDGEPVYRKYGFTEPNSVVLDLAM